MKFSSFPVEKTEGMILAHSVHASDITFKKGRVLSKDDVQTLVNASITTVYAAELEENDIAEDEAAGAIATALSGVSVRTERPFTGRANIYATSNGILRFNEDTFHALNALDEAITVATLRDHDAIAEGQMLATIKIIPFAITKELLDEALSIIGGSAPLLSVAPYRLKTADLILTTVPGMKASLLPKSEKVIAARLMELGIELTSVMSCLHEEESICNALRTSPSKSEMTLILGASATVDRRDVVPAAIEQSGGNITHFGMPVDPGNLLLLAEIEGRPVLGLPGCARSPKLNGADWVLQRLAAGIAVGATEIQAMGVGGLLKEIPSRPQPRDRQRDPMHQPRVAAIILGGGKSTRMGEINKLTAPFNGKPMISHVADAALSSKADGIILVTGHEEEQVLKALAGRPMSFAHNPDFADGLSTSIRTGITAAGELEPTVDAAIILLGDMPLVTADLINQLIAAHDPDEDRYVCVPTVGTKRGNPVLWDAAFFDALQALNGDVGAKSLIAENADLVCEVPVEGDASLTDFDTPEALQNGSQD